MVTLVLCSYSGHSWKHFVSLIGYPSASNQSQTKLITWNLSCQHHSGNTGFTHNFLQFSKNIPFIAMISFHLLKHHWNLLEPQPGWAWWITLDLQQNTVLSNWYSIQGCQKNTGIDFIFYTLWIWGFFYITSWLYPFCSHNNGFSFLLSNCNHFVVLPCLCYT